jgi:hypothetical protein
VEQIAKVSKVNFSTSDVNKNHVFSIIVGIGNKGVLNRNSNTIDLIVNYKDFKGKLLHVLRGSDSRSSVISRVGVIDATNVVETTSNVDVLNFVANKVDENREATLLILLDSIKVLNISSDALDLIINDSNLK